MKLGWNDLLIQNAPPAELWAALAPWSFLIEGRVAPIFLNRFGCWFLQRPDGPIETLNVLDGSIEKVAESNEAFQRSVNLQAWQERYLLSLVVFDLHLHGKVAAGSQCYGIAPHPALGGPNPVRGDPLPHEQTLVMSLSVWQSICRQALGGPA